MSRASRFIPSAKFYRTKSPNHPAFVFHALSKDMISQAATKSGGKSELQWITLKDEELVHEAEFPGWELQYEHFKPPALILNSEIRWMDTYYPGSWVYEPSREEQTWRAYQSLQFQTQLDTLEAKDDPSDDEIAQMNDLELRFAMIAEGGPGLFEEGTPGFLGADVHGLWWKLCEPNIPVTVTSAFTTQRNRAISLRLHRSALPEGQVRGTFTIEIGAGNSLYSLVIGEDGNSSEFFHYNNMPKSTRDGWLEQLELLKDYGRLTVVDLGNIVLWKDQINAIKLEAKERTNNSKLTPKEHEVIAGLQKQIKDLRESKTNAPTWVQDEIQRIETILYVAHDKLSLQEDSKNTLGTSVDITFLFLRSGYIVIQTKDTRKIYENKRVTGGINKKDPIYVDMLPPKAYITLKSDGGSWGVLWGHPEFKSKGTIYSTPFEVPFEFEPEEIGWISEYTAGTLDGENNPYGAVEFSLDTVQEPVYTSNQKTHGRYRVKIDLTTRNSGYTPELYYVEMYMLASAVTSHGDTVWNSDSKPAGLVLDVQIREEKDRSRFHTVFIANNLEESGIPGTLGGCSCDVIVTDSENDSDTYLVESGCVVHQDRGEHRNLSTSGNILYTGGAVGNIVKCEVIGCEGFLDTEVQACVSGNNQYVGDYLRILAQNAGLLDTLYENLPIGNAGDCPRIKAARPGTIPDVKPATGANLWQWMREVVKKHAPRWQLWSDVDGLQLTKTVARRKTGVNFSSTVDVESHSALRRMSTDPGGLSLVQDLRDFWTSATFTGRIDPNTGIRVSATAEIPQAYDSHYVNSMYYIGVKRHYTAHRDESLETYDDCLQAAREHLNINQLTTQGLLPWNLSWKVDLDPTIRCGDLLRVNGIWFLIESIDFAALNSNTLDGQMMRITGRLAEEKKLP